VQIVKVKLFLCLLNTTLSRIVGVWVQFHGHTFWSVHWMEVRVSFRRRPTYLLKHDAPHPSYTCQCPFDYEVMWAH